ncbi:hypothetical protein DL89DRAFT_79966 [Linderina pennispora]|uniref:RING-type domain-containing protein n=1 Tax=Linderina pennispora TaxID=61395 RepID=A0A1Y1WGK5_9FUNG|nr:uncharacterized protein DL89DRAFT_79966 [Linderina pennispora]ORX72602.1 hypothetical protein DL89DRAFT_79966 [Linderina pennispora]
MRPPPRLPVLSPGGARKGHSRKGSGFFHRLKVSSASSSKFPGDGTQSPSSPSSPRPGNATEMSGSGPETAESCELDVEVCRRLLRRYIECPICFLYYPQNINYTRCCHKPVCTECFVQIKRKLRGRDHLIHALPVLRRAQFRNSILSAVHHHWCCSHQLHEAPPAAQLSALPELVHIYCQQCVAAQDAG